MSQANIPNITPLISVTTAQTIPLLLASVALEELALAHIVNAEAEKVQFVLGTLTTGVTFSPAIVSLSNLLDLDLSVQRSLRDVIKKEILLEFKFDNVLDLIGDITSSSSLSLLPITISGTTCPVSVPISGTLTGVLGTPIVGATVSLSFTPITPGATVSFSAAAGGTIPPVTDITGSFGANATLNGSAGSNTVVITASTTVAGITISTSQTVTFSCSG